MNTHTETLRNPFVKSCKKPGLSQQFGHPQGRVGALIGHLMALKNRKVNEAVVDVLDVQADDRVLEIGFGPGKTLQALTQRATGGLIAGADPSDVMVRQAARRNQAAIEAGRLRLERAGVSSLPFEDGAFTKAVSINSFHHWPQPETDLKEVRRVLRPGGALVLGLRLKDPSKKFLAPPGFTEGEIADVEALLLRLGFRNVGTAIRAAGNERVAAVLAWR